MPTADIDKAYNSLKTTELKDKELTFYVADKNAFNAGALDEKQWMDAVSEKLGLKPFGEKAEAKAAAADASLPRRSPS